MEIMAVRYPVHVSLNTFLFASSVIALSGFSSFAKSIYVSQHGGQDQPGCGGTVQNACFSLGYTFWSIFRDGDEVLLDGCGKTDCIFTYSVERSIVLSGSISLTGFNGTPCISHSNTSTLPWLFLLQNTSLLMLKGVHFSILGLASYSHDVDIYLVNCTFLNVSLPIITDRIADYNGTSNIRIYGCRFLDCSSVLVIGICDKCLVNISDSICRGKPSRRLLPAVVMGSYVHTNRAVDGAIVPNSVHMVVKNSHFEDLIAAFSLMYASAPENFYVTIDNCLFRNISLQNSMYVHVHSVFAVNLRTESSVARSTVSFVDCTFERNRAFRGVVGLLFCVAEFTGCRFIQNEAVQEATGGACYLRNVNASFSQCVFQANVARSTVSYSEMSYGYGGAIAVRGKTWCHINSCVFDNNTASTRGGAIDNFGMYLSMRNTSVNGSSDALDPVRAVGYLIYSFSQVLLQDCSFSVDETKNPHPAVFLSTGDFSQSLAYSGLVRFGCPVNHNSVIYEHPVSRNFAADVLSLSCEKCYSIAYSLKSGIAVVNDSHVWDFSRVSCNECGIACAECDLGIGSKAHYWLYNSSDGSFHAIQCPWAYCSSSDGCDGITACAEHRHGRLCGRCLSGYSETMFSPKCVPDAHCGNAWFWPVLFFITCLYMFLIMFLTNLFDSLLCLLNQSTPSDERQVLDSTLIQPLLASEDTSTVSFARLSDNDGFISCGDVTMCSQAENGASSLANDSLRMLCNIHSAEKSVTQYGYAFGIFKILVFFYQALFLIHERYLSDGSHDFPHVVGYIFGGIYNLHVTDMFSIGADFCPMRGLTGISKQLLNISFIAVILFMLFLLYVAWTLYKTYFTVQENSEQTSTVPCCAANSEFLLRVKCCLVQLLLLSYCTIATSAFQLIHCVYMYDNGIEGKFLYVDASIQCYEGWQYIFILFAALWVFPFYISLSVAMSLLRKRSISSSMFLIAICCPPLLLLHIRHWGHHAQENLQFTLEDNTSDHLLLVLDAPFRKKNCDGSPVPKHECLNWECVLVFRRLLLCILGTFVVDSVLRQYVTIILLISFLIHHLWLQPYSWDSLNQLETLLLLLLILLVPFNMARAYNMGWPIGEVPIRGGLEKISVLGKVLIEILPLVLLVLLLSRKIVLIMHRFCRKKKCQ